MPEQMPAAIGSAISGVAPLVVDLTWQGELAGGTSVDEHGFPALAALPVPGTITLIDEHGRAAASYEVLNLPRELAELAREPTQWIRRVGVGRRACGPHSDLALRASEAMAQVDEWILATAYIPEHWSDARQ